MLVMRITAVIRPQVMNLIWYNCEPQLTVIGGIGAYIHPKNMRVMLLVEMIPVIAVLDTFADAHFEITIRRLSRALPVAGWNTRSVGMLALYNRGFSHRYGL